MRLPHLGYPSGYERELPTSEVHVWHAALDAEPGGLAELTLLLTAPERERASRYRFRVHERRFISGRAALRIILSRYLCCQPSKIQFDIGPYGKPSIATYQNAAMLKFNLSHTGDLGVIAVARERTVGVDVERVRPIVDAEDLAARFFTERESASIRSLPAELRHTAFFTCWTRKEAFIKARGEGLSCPLDAFDVSVLPDEPASLLNIQHGLDDGRSWSLKKVKTRPNYVATVAAEGSDWHLIYRSFDEEAESHAARPRS